MWSSSFSSSVSMNLHVIFSLPSNIVLGACLTLDAFELFCCLSAVCFVVLHGGLPREIPMPFRCLVLHCASLGRQGEEWEIVCHYLVDEMKARLNAHSRLRSRCTEVKCTHKPVVLTMTQRLLDGYAVGRSAAAVTREEWLARLEVEEEGCGTIATGLGLPWPQIKG